MLSFFRKKTETKPEPQSSGNPTSVELTISMTPDFKISTKMVIPPGQDSWAWSAVNLLFKPEIIPHFLDRLEKPIDSTALDYVRFTAIKFLETESKLYSGQQPAVHPGKVI